MKTKEELEVFEAQREKYMVNFPRPAKQASAPGRKKLDPITLAVIKARVDGIINEMVQTIIRTARNPILSGVKDITCSILTYDGFLLTMANSLPVLLGCLDSTLWAVMKAYKDDIHPGDVFAINDPYYGGNHVGDFVMHAPIFYDGELVAWASSLCHLIDIGAHVPATGEALAKDVYEEGIHFPPLRICKNHQEITEMVRFIKANFRYPEQWHGDFLAQAGSLWIAERRILELCKKYGGAVIKQFQDEYLDYGDRRMVEEIKKLPKGEWHIESLSEKLEPVCPDGVLLKVTMSIDPGEAMIYFDLTDMPDNLAWGWNASYATSRTACMQGSLPSLDPTLPRNEGVFRHFKIYMREGALVGMPKWPVGTSIATTSMADETTSMVFNLWEQVKAGLGHAGGGEVGGTVLFTSGTDFRRGNEPWGHINFVGCCGGPASKGCDGWPNWLTHASMGNTIVESVELIELRVPQIVWEVAIQTDSGGAGKWRGGVGISCKFQPRHTKIRGIARCTGFTRAPLGVAMGKSGALCKHWIEKHGTYEKVRDLTNSSEFDLQEDEDWVCLNNGGGGYGDPLERDPEAVRDDVRNYLVSLKAAHDEYGVVLNTDPELYEVDYDATERLRAQLRKGRRTK